MSPRWRATSAALVDAVSALSPSHLHSRHGIGASDLESQGLVRDKSGTMPSAVEARIYAGTHGTYAESAEFGLAATPLGGTTPRLRWEDEEPLELVGGMEAAQHGDREWKVMMESPGDSPHE